MDLTVIVLATAVSALFGTSVGILLLRRKLRPPITDAELAELKGKLQTSESSMSAASANLEDLRKQIALQETSLRQNGEELNKRQAQLDRESAETQKEKGLRSAAEQSVQELSARAAVLTEQCTKLEAKVTEAQSLAAAKATQLASTEAELEGGKRKIQELTEQSIRIGEQEAGLRTLLEAQLNAEQERIRQMTVQIAELQSERTKLEIKLQEENRSAAKGMELLLMAQEKLSAVFKSLGVDGQNGHHSPVPVEAAGPEAKSEVAEIAQAEASAA